jgi:hypothetical protein
MDSMSGRSRRHQSLSLLGLPQDIHIEIVARVDTTPERPLADIRSLRGTCSTMLSSVWDPIAYKAFLAMLTGLGNPEVCFLSEINAFFIENWG